MGGSFAVMTPVVYTPWVQLTAEFWQYTDPAGVVWAWSQKTGTWQRRVAGGWGPVEYHTQGYPRSDQS